MKTKHRLPILALCASLPLVAACGPDAPDSVQQLDLVVTSYQPNFKFKEAQTYALPDKVVVIADPGTTPPEVDSALSQHILETIAGELNARGYTKVANDGSAKPSVFVEVSKMTTTQTNYYYSYWSSYYGGYYAPYYGGAYGVGWAPVAVPYVTQTTLGSLIMNATDPNHPDEANKTIPSVWAGVLNGIIDNATTAEIQARADKGIKQAFAQSPYFTRSGS